jgi:DNA primase
MIPAIEYIYSRGLTLHDYNFYVSEKEIQDRLIIPFYFEDRVVGYTARKLGEGKPKYLSEQTPGYVFNLDQQAADSRYVIVVEGPIDAISIGGVAILGADIMDKQSMLINRLGKQVIVLPDRDTDGSRTVNRAVELGWGVSMPEWDLDIKDANDAVRRYGRLYTIWSIIHSHEVNELKIQLRMKKWFG